MRNASIGLRLVVWYAGLLAAALAIFGFLAVWQLRRSVIANADAQLAQVRTGIESVVRENVPRGEAELREEVGEYAAELKPAIALEVEMDGAWIAGPAPAEASARTFFERLDVEGHRFLISASISIAPGLAMVASFSRALVALAPLLLLFACAAGYWISRRALRPVDAITAEARSIGVDNLSRRLKVPSAGDELTRLATAWNEMLARLEASVDRLTRFTADASHEMRSPVAVIRATAELALRRERSEDDYQAALGEVLRQAGRLSSLLEDLLALARAEAAADSLFASVDPAVPARAACDLLETAARRKEIRIATHFEPAVVEGHEPSLRRLITILLDNAVKFSPEGSRITVRIQTVPGSGVELSVEDNGPGISAEDLPHIFERFWRADDVRTPGAAGAGLGLSMAESIARSHGAEIQVESGPSRGSVFRVKFPAALRSSIPPEQSAPAPPPGTAARAR